jgi:hypothetical protein
MSDFITLSCPSCGAKLSITPDIDRFACSHCGQEHIIKRGGGIVSLSPVVGAINQVGVRVDRVAAELAAARLQREIGEASKEKDKILENYPEPVTKQQHAIALIGGAIIVLVTMGHLQSLFLFILFIFGVILTVDGGLRVFLFNPAAKHNWKIATGKRIQELDAQIAKRQAQLKNYQDLLSQ